MTTPNILLFSHLHDLILTKPFELSSNLKPQQAIIGYFYLFRGALVVDFSHGAQLVKPASHLFRRCFPCRYVASRIRNQKRREMVLEWCPSVQVHFSLSMVSGGLAAACRERPVCPGLAAPSWRPTPIRRDDPARLRLTRSPTPARGSRSACNRSSKGGLPRGC